jgi:hypothetical protein
MRVMSRVAGMPRADQMLFMGDKNKEESKRFFFYKKRSKKIFVCWDLWQRPGKTAPKTKVFCFFFSKKKCLLR